jgi:hypothetical protein
VVRRSAGAAEPILPCRVEGGYFVPVPGGILDPDDEADVPGGAPVIIEDFFKDRFRQAPGPRPPRPDPAADDVGVNFWSDPLPFQHHSRGERGWSTGRGQLFNAVDSPCSGLILHRV